jgi:hypothetical protein
MVRFKIFGFPESTVPGPADGGRSRSISILYGGGGGGGELECSSPGESNRSGAAESTR